MPRERPEVEVSKLLFWWSQQIVLRDSAILFYLFFYWVLQAFADNLQAPKGADVLISASTSVHYKPATKRAF